jgi:hypothetical protein
LFAINLIGVIACNRIAKRRHSKHIAFWTTMGVLLGPLPIPLLLWLNPERSNTLNGKLDNN